MPYLSNKIKFLFILFLIVTTYLLIITEIYASPSYGTKLPQKKKFSMGLQTHSIFKRYLENEYGKLRSQQEFLLLSYGVFDWLSIDLKAGVGFIKQHPEDQDELDYPTYLGGGYGFRLKFYDRKNLKMIFGFQHISVHPKSIRIGGIKHKAVLDDWQVSSLVSYCFLKKIAPYLGTKLSRADYIHWVDSNRNRVKSDLTKGVGLILGCDLSLTERIWFNLEGQFFDNEILAFSMNFSF